MSRINLRLAPWLVGAAALLAAALFESAAAIEVQCIEESKYKHLYQLFGGDARKLAAYLEIDTDRYHLPDPEACRAALVTGGIGQPNDRDKLLDLVVRNKGWLAAVYLNSGGGDVWTGQQLGYIVRAFRLKTFTARNAGNKLLYEPDFALAPRPPAAPAAAAAATAGVVDAGKPQPPRCQLNEHVPTALGAKGAVSGISRPETFKPTYEENIDHPGGDYRQFDLPNADPKLCQKQCMDDAKCRAWAFRKPDGSGGRPHCSLKERVLARSNDTLAVAGIARADAADATYEENTIRPGTAYRDFDLPNADPRLCQKSCIDEAKCRGWVYRKPEGRTDGHPHCWLQARAGAPKNDKLDIAGIVVRLQYAEPTYEENSERPGSDYREFDLPNADPKLCQRTCIGEARCRAWVYRKPEGRTDHHPHCWLKEHVPAVVREDNLTVSGTVIRADGFEPTFEKDLDRPGQPYRSLDLTYPDPRACQKACADDAKCRAWAYEKPNSAYLVALATGWDAYRNRQRSIVSTPAPGSNFCASSCVQLHVAGLDRSGVIQVHRPNQGFSAMSQQAENLTLSDANMPQFYQYMDAGPRITQLMQETSATTVTATFASRFPRYVLDYLIVHCQVDPEQLQGLEKELETTLKELNPAAADLSVKSDHMAAALGKMHERRRRAEQCVAQAQEQDRLAAYDKLCGNSCDQKKLGADFDAAVRKIHAQNR